jgi:uncharacterized membrane protein|tara:strand:+ start:438 stop:653 length:216 start_codon:yes stop_codon:yes gene_type:complete
MVNAAVSILLLSLGVFWISRFPGFLLLSAVVLSYQGLSTLVTPYLRHARKQGPAPGSAHHPSVAGIACFGP